MPPRNPIRRSALVGIFGVGGMVELPYNQTCMVAGLDQWPFARMAIPEEWQVLEERLTARLGVSELRSPPDYREHSGSDTSHLCIPALRFPRWHYCPVCGDMQFLPLEGSDRRRCRGPKSSRCEDMHSTRRPFVIPARFVAACTDGHIQDFPFLEWVHDGETPDEHRLRYETRGSSASLSGIVIRCDTCSRNRSMRGSFDYDEATGGALARVGVSCRANTPWLGVTSVKDAGGCAEHLRVLQRGASNVFFPVTLSSIYLPLWAEQVDRQILRIIEDPLYWGILARAVDEDGQVLTERVKMVAESRQVDTEALRTAAQQRLDGAASTSSATTEEEYRRAEYQAFVNGRGAEQTDLLVNVRNGSEFPALADFIDRVCLIRKLRETRALAGFTRILPPEGIGANDRIQKLSRVPLRWRPAVVVRGEGLFLEFKFSAIESWLKQNPQMEDRTAHLAENFNRRRVEQQREPQHVNSKFLLLHTLSHLLIKQLSFDCGYGSASVRERIYCDVSADADPMQGILIYTASGDAEGTMGGLVRQGEPGRLEPIFLEAIRAASWCSSDPVCIESMGQGTDNANLAACHACTLLSETSCEEGNRLLDRMTVVGGMHDHSVGFLGDLLVG